MKMTAKREGRDAPCPKLRSIWGALVEPFFVETRCRSAKLPTRETLFIDVCFGESIEIAEAALAGRACG